MKENGFKHLYWGFILVMISFRICGFDILPDILGYIFFALGLSELGEYSDYFRTAGKFNIPVLIMSIFSIYQVPAQGNGIQLGVLGWYGLVITVLYFILNLFLIYNMFMGISDMALKQENEQLAEETIKVRNQYLMLQGALLLCMSLIFVPFIAMAFIIILIIFTLVVLFNILKLINRCIEFLV